MAQVADQLPRDSQIYECAQAPLHSRSQTPVPSQSQLPGTRQQHSDEMEKADEDWAATPPAGRSPPQTSIKTSLMDGGHAMDMQGVLLSPRPATAVLGESGHAGSHAGNAGEDGFSMEDLEVAKALTGLRGRKFSPFFTYFSSRCALPCVVH